MPIALKTTFYVLLGVVMAAAGAAVALQTPAKLTKPSVSYKPKRVAMTAAQTGRFVGNLVKNIRASSRTTLASRAVTKLTKGSQRLLSRTAPRRGTTVTVTVQGKYGGYTATDVVKVCDAIAKTKTVKRCELKRSKNETGPFKFPKKVPKSTVERYLVTDKATGKPKYEQLRNQTMMPPKEPPLLGKDVDLYLQLTVFMAHRVRRPFRKKGITDVARRIAIAQGAKIRTKGGALYTESTRMDTWFDGFAARAARNGLAIVQKESHAMSRVRVDAMSRESVDDFTVQIMHPTLKKVQDDLNALGIRMGWGHVANYDEWQLDLTRYAAKGRVLVIDGEMSNMITPFERSPHITVVSAFTGAGALTTAVLLPRSTIQPLHAQHLGDDDRVAVYCTQDGSGWVSNPIKVDLFGRWVADGTNVIGQQPTLMTCDGHGTNTMNLNLILAMKANMTDCIITPSHHTSVLQAADAKDGPISNMQTIIHGTIETHFMAGNKHLSAAQIAWIVEDASRRVDVAVYKKSLMAVGWRMKHEGTPDQILEFEPLAVIRPDKLGANAPAPNVTRSGSSCRKDAPMDAAIAAAAAAAAASPANGVNLLEQAAKIVGASRTSAVPKDQHKGRGGSRKSYNAGGLCMTSEDHLNELRRLEVERDAQAKKSNDSHLAYVHKWRKKLNDASAKLAANGNDYKKLSNPELIAFILAREGKQPTKKDKKSMAAIAELVKNKPVTLGKCAICVEKLDDYTRMLEEGVAV